MTIFEHLARKPTKLRVIIAGSRHLVNPQVISEAVAASGLFSVIGTILSGGCTGVDRFGERWAKANRIPVQKYPADWTHLGPQAGPVRNQMMVDHSDALIAIKIAGVETRGTDDVIRKATARKLPVFVYTVSKETAFKGVATIS